MESVMVGRDPQAGAAEPRRDERGYRASVLPTPRPQRDLRTGRHGLFEQRFKARSQRWGPCPHLYK